MKFIVLSVFLLALSLNGFASPVSTVPRTLICNNGAMVLQESLIPPAQRQFPDYAVIAYVFDAHVVNYLSKTYGFGGDAAYGKTAYYFDSQKQMLIVEFFGESTLDMAQLMTGGKFSNAFIVSEGAGKRLILRGGGKEAQWFFESCR